MENLTQDQWLEYEALGYLRLGATIAPDDLTALQRRIDEIMMGTARLDYDALMMQRDTDTGAYADLGPQTLGHKGPSLDYRKMEGLEQDPLFLTHMQRPLFREICARVYGAGTAISCYRAMFMNKPAGKGTVLPWHQDRWNELDRNPRVTVWTALDDSTVENGCITVLTGSHKLGLINERSAFFTEEQSRDLEARFDSVVLEFQAGESVVLHNWLLHTSGVNRTDRERRAFSAAYMEAATRASNGREFPVIFGEGAIAPQAA